MTNPGPAGWAWGICWLMFASTVLNYMDRQAIALVRPQVQAEFTVDYQTGIVTVPLVNVDRFDRVSLEFHSQSIDEPVLDDLLKFILGRDSSFLRRAPLAGLHGTPRGG